MNNNYKRLDIDSGIELLTKDAKMEVLISKYGRPDLLPKNDYFQSLMRSIVFQQLSGKAANTIYQRLVSLLPDKKNNPKEVLNLTDENMRKAGLSFQKIKYIKNLAVFFNNNSFHKRDVNKMTDEEISNQLIEIKGIGQWTVDMFLMFTLNRPDIMPYADLGIQKGMKILFKMDNLPSKDEMRNHSEIWRPYRTVACWYLWKIVDDDFIW